MKYIYNTLLSTIFITMSYISINRRILGQNHIMYISTSLEKVTCYSTLGTGN